MHKTLLTALRTSIIAFGLVGLSACATVTPEQLSAVEAKVSSAMSEARSASSTAKQALDAANKAAEAAASAQSSADAAMACCNDNKDRIERMFEQTMKK